MTAPRIPAPDPVAAPVAIWRLNDSDSQPAGMVVGDASQSATEPPSGFLSRLSQRLVLTYTAHGDIVVDLQGDAHLRQATERLGRGYLPVADQAAIAELDQRATPTSLIVAGRWSVADGHALTSINDLFLACRLIMTADLAALAVIGPADPRHQTTRHDLQVLQAAATSAGLLAAGTILTIHRPGKPDRFLFYASDDDVAAALAAEGPTTHPAMWIDVFATTAGDNPRA